MKSRRQGDTLVLTARGVGSLGALTGLLSQAVLCLAERDARAVVLDLTDLIPAMSEEEWREAANDPMNAAIGLPVALVVKLGDERSAIAHCQEVARLFGGRRMAFSELESAIIWTRSRHERRGAGAACVAPPETHPRPALRKQRLWLVP